MRSSCRDFDPAKREKSCNQVQAEFQHWRQAVAKRYPEAGFVVHLCRYKDSQESHQQSQDKLLSFSVETSGGMAFIKQTRRANPFCPV